MCMKHFGRLDIVVNNAGVFDASIDQWSTMVNVNYVSFSHSDTFLSYDNLKIQYNKIKKTNMLKNSLNYNKK